MKRSDLILHMLRHFWRTNLGVILGVALSSMVITGALLVGDSIKASLHTTALSRIGEFSSLMHTHDRYFQDDLEARLSPSNGVAVATLHATGSIVLQSSQRRSNHTQIYGVNSNFWTMSVSGTPIALAEREFAIGDALARKLDAKLGDSLIARLPKPGLLPAGTALSASRSDTVALKGKLTHILSDEDFGRFSLKNEHVAPDTVFVDRAWLQKGLERPGQANMLLTDAGEAKSNSLLREAIELEDLQLRLYDQDEQLTLQSERVYIDSAWSQALTTAGPTNFQAMTWFVNSIESDGRASPYSMVAGVKGALISPHMSKTGIVLNKWLASDLNAKKGDPVILQYLTTSDGVQLTTNIETFVVHSIISNNEALSQQGLSPHIPGLTDAESCREWDEDLPIDRNLLRDKDQAYWEKYRALPKAFIHLSKAREMWANPYGNATGIRISPTTDVLTHLRSLTPLAPGFEFVDIRGPALRSVDQAFDFRTLFVGFSFLLIVSAMMLTALLFSLGMQQRSLQAGTMLAIGFQGKDLSRVFFSEGLLLALIGSGLGAALAGTYTHTILQALDTVWSAGLPLPAVTYASTSLSYVIGIASTFCLAALSIGYSLRRLVSHKVASLCLNPDSLETLDSGGLARLRRRHSWISTLLALMLIGAMVSASSASGMQSQMTYVAAGFIALLLCLSLSRIMLTVGAVQPTRARRSLESIGFRALARRATRSMTIIALIAFSSFIVLTIDAYRHDADVDALNPRSGTGGFSLIGEFSAPLYTEPGSALFVDDSGLSEAEMKDVAFHPFRSLRGDDASCLNLNRAQQPGLIALRPDDMQARDTFAFKQVIDPAYTENPWSCLAHPLPAGTLAVIADQATLQWGLKKKVGDTLDLIGKDGAPLKAVVVGMTGMNFLQGSLITSEDQFAALVSSDGGYTGFLVDAPVRNVSAIQASLSQAWADRGLEVNAPVQRLAALMEVENTNMKIFQALGAIGLILGLMGLGIVVARHTLERRPEFAAMQAIGFRRKRLIWLILTENWALIAAGLLSAIVASTLALWPQLLEDGFDLTPLLYTCAAIALNGMMWSWLSAWAVLQRDPIESLRRE